MADTKLHTAVRYGNEDLVLAALAENLDPNQTGMFKWTPVHEAAHNGDRDILKLLLFHEGDVNCVDELHGNSPLHYAAREDNSACVTVLLKAGAAIDIVNREGQTCLDLATPLCREMIERHAGGPESEWRGGPRDPNNNPGTGSMIRNQTQDKWSTAPCVPPQAEIGHVHLSFEYHKTTLKVRVWQVSDLLLPPPQTSMIESIFVRGFFIPDPAKKTNRRTEAVKVDGSSIDEVRAAQSATSGIQHIFSPSSFRFETPLLYTGVTADIITKRSVQLEVCMTQKHTRKPFLMAMMNMPLRTAVRRPIREKYSLIPCMNYTIPNTMRVYSARDIFLEGSSSSSGDSKKVSSLSRSNSSQSGRESPLTARDVHLEGVNVENLVKRFISVDVSDSDDDGIGSSFEVKMSPGKSQGSSTVTIDVSSVTADDGDDSSNGLREVVEHRSSPDKERDSSVVLNMDVTKQKPKKKIIPNELLNTESPPPSPLVPFQDKKAADSTTIEIEARVKEATVVDITSLQRDVVLNLDSGSGEGSSSDTCNAQIQGSQADTLKRKKKKIIPNELVLNTEEMRDSHTASPQGGPHLPAISGTAEGNMCVYDDITHDKSNGSDSTLNPEVCKTHDGGENSLDDFIPTGCQYQDDDGEDSISSELDPSRHLSVEDQVTTPASRPETPIWDYYDFTEEEKNAALAMGVVISGSESAPADDMQSSGTLQESLSRLSRPSHTLDTCRVMGPVLPTVMVDDFEMDEET